MPIKLYFKLLELVTVGFCQLFTNPSTMGQACTSPRVPRQRPAPPTAATAAPASSPVPTVPIPSDRDRAEPVETPFLRLTPPPGGTPTAPTKLDALGDVAELQFADPVVRYLHADWEREQQAEPTCYAAMRYITIGWPSALPPDFLSCYPSRKRPSLSDIQELAGTGRIHTTNDIVLLVRICILIRTYADLTFFFCLRYTICFCYCLYYLLFLFVFLLR